MGFNRDGISDYATQLIKRKTRQLVGRYGFTKLDFEDLKQEMMLDLLQRQPKYNPDRAQINTFVARIIENKVASIIAARKADKRDYRLCCCSLNEQFEDKDGRSIERAETAYMTEYLRRTGKSTRSHEELTNQAIDLQRTQSELPPNLRDLCDCLGDEDITAIARKLNRHRSTVHEHIKRIRILFKNRGLKEYL